MAALLETLTEDQRDALKELMNIAMGQAADRLARLIDTLVILSVPSIRLATECAPDLSDCPIFSAPSAYITRQSFLGALRGEVLVCFEQDGADELASLMGFDENLNTDEHDELMLDVTNILSSACIKGLAEQLELPASFGAPSILATNSTLFDKVGDVINRDQTLILEICFKVESHSFTCDLLVCVARESLPSVIEAINRMLEDL
ncbi:MAG: chemotaxis protein CheC [Gammaproteobacteria bacterium]|nr:MAG: chemotaxis protein CheC [Gammaproteobacteria bacterium]